MARETGIVGTAERGASPARYSSCSREVGAVEIVPLAGERMPKESYTFSVPRPRNHVPTETLTISTTPHVISELESLVETGHFGKNVAEAAERIIAGYLHEAVRQGALPKSRRVSGPRV